MFKKEPITESVTTVRQISGRIADLVYFYKYVEYRCPNTALSDDELVELAHDFWDMEHGE